MTLTITPALSILFAFVVIDFVLTSVITYKMGLFENSGSYFNGLNALFLVLIYLAFFAVPSLSALAIWAIFFRG